MSADGSTLAVGAPDEASNARGINGNQADNSMLSAGAVYILVRSGSSWVQQAYIKASNTDKGDLFGTSLALSADGSTLAVGATSEASAATGVNGNQSDNSAFSAGAVYVFTRSGTTWSQQAYVKASNTVARDQFGTSVALSADGSMLAVGAQNEGNSVTGINGDQNLRLPTTGGSGAVYLFTRSGLTWSQQVYFKASNTGIGDHFGASVALSADGATLAGGAAQERSAATGINGNQADDSAVNAGAVYVFTRSGATWSQQAYIKASNTNAQDEFGRAIGLSADGATLAISARSEDSAAVGVNGNQADNSASNAGAAYVFTRSGATWSQQAYIKASNTGAGDQFGQCLSLSADGNTLAVTAQFEDSPATGIGGDQVSNVATDAGAAYVFQRTGATWSQVAYVKATNTEINDQYGASVAVSGDGTALAVGAIFEDGAGNLATSSGAVYMYQ